MYDYDDEEEIRYVLLGLMKDENLDIDDAIQRFEDANNGNYDTKVLADVVAQIKGESEKLEYQSERDGIPLAAASKNEWEVTDAEAAINVELYRRSQLSNNEDISPPTDYPKDPLEGHDDL